MKKTQKITSKKTALNQIPKIHKFLIRENLINENETILDYGCGFGKGKFYLEENVKCKVDNYDKFNNFNEIRQIKYNKVLCSNVLNVIDDLETVKQIIKDLLNLSDTIYISIYECDRSNIGKVTSKGFQRNEKTENYITYIKEVSENLKKKLEIKKKENMIFVKVKENV